MKPEYQQFIDQHYPDYEHAYGKCHSAAEHMQSVFHELRIVKGWVFCSWGQRDHVWLETSEGERVDPTGKQFPGWPNLPYEEWKPGMPVCVGTCCNCGEDIYKALQSLDEPGHGTSICSPSCEAEYMAYLNNELENIWYKESRRRK